MNEHHAIDIAYRLLARLFAEGLTAANVEELGKVEELAAFVPDSPDFDQLAADHYAALSLGVPPHESVFADAEGVIGGAASRAVVDSYDQIGFRYDLTDRAPDHISVELQALSTAMASSESDERLLLDKHLLRWVPAFTCSLSDVSLYGEAARLLLAVLLEHHALVGGSATGQRLELRTPPLEDKHTSLRDIADFLCCPAHSGLWLSRTDISELGRGQRVPRGFGSRVLMLNNLLSSAGERSVLPDVLRGLRALILRRRDFFVALALPDYAGEWLERLDNSDAMLARMDQAAREVA